MKFEFSRKTRELFDRGGWMQSHETGKNNADCLHHILGRVSSSPYNAAPLNNMYDHQPEGRKDMESIHSLEVRSVYLEKTKKYLEEIGYTPTEKDLEFIKEHKKYYEYYKQNCMGGGDNPFKGIIG